MKNFTWILPAIVAIAIPNTVKPADAAACNKTSAGTFSGKAVSRLGEAVLFKSPRMAVDADGAPNSYQTDGKGLSFTCDGLTAVGSTPESDPHHWEEKCRAAWVVARESGDYSGVKIFGFQTDDHNSPLVQKDGDPLPKLGYISTTSVSVSDGPVGTQRHWVDATKIPYIVLSSTFTEAFSVAPADLAIVYYPKFDKVAFAVYGDGGRLGEASVRLHQNLGSNPLSHHNDVTRANVEIDDPVLTIVLPGMTTHPTVDDRAWNAEIQRLGAKALADLGGLAQVKACAD